jgi:ATP-dependent protease ClpP protease subunit
MPDYRTFYNRSGENSIFKPMRFKIVNQDEGNTAIIDIDGFIGKDIFYEWMTGEKSPNSVDGLKEQLRSITAGKIIVNINSPGGDFNDGLVIKNMLESKNAQVVTNLYGLSASAATAIHQGGNIRRMAKNTSFMLIHRVMYGLVGYYNQNSLRSLVEQQETMDRNLISMYASGSEATDQQITELMDAGEGYGKWVDADEALELGLIDEIFDPADAEDENVDRLEGRKDEDEQNLGNLNDQIEKSVLLTNIHQDPDVFLPENDKSDDDKADSVRIDDFLRQINEHLSWLRNLKNINGDPADQHEESEQSDASGLKAQRERELRERQLKQRGMNHA